MMNFIVRVAFMLLVALGGSNAQAALNVLACEPEWADLVAHLGGDRVKVSSATTGRQDSHHVQARPSLIARTRNADLLVCTAWGSRQAGCRC